MLLALAVTAGIISCSKDNDEVKGFQIEGNWTGKIGTGNVVPNGFFGMKIKPGGFLERTNSQGDVTATGNWQLNGKTFHATYQFTSGTDVEVNGTLDAQNKLSGSWSNDGGESGMWNAVKN